MADACHGGSDEIVEYLLEKGADVKLVPYAIFDAILNPITLGLLLKNGADVNVRKSKDDPIEPGYQPIHFVALTSRKESLKMLLEAKADPRSLTTHGETPLDILKYGHDYIQKSGRSTPQREQDYREMEEMLIKAENLRPTPSVEGEEGKNNIDD
ncbi:MAG: hypothetical protein H0X29_06790 [Parachlamydiaceae bacterium]|nr:hypothetical protein [Parachlamydiaceae bacterium]